MQRKHFVFGAAVASIVLAGCLIYGFFHPQSRPHPQASIDELAATQLNGVTKGLLGESYITHRLPASAITDEDGKPLLSWRVKILPYLDQYDLYREFNLDEPWDSEHNKPLIAKMPDVYKSPLAGDLGGKTVYLVPTGPETIFSGTDPIDLGCNHRRPGQHDHAGGSRSEHAVLWTKPEDLTIDKNNPAAVSGPAAKWQFGRRPGQWIFPRPAGHD